MLLPFLVFVVVTGAIAGGYFAVTWLPGAMAARRLERRLHDVSFGVAEGDPKAADSTVVKHIVEGPFPAMDRMLSRSGGGERLALLIERAGVRTTPAAI